MPLFLTVHDKNGEGNLVLCYSATPQISYTDLMRWLEKNLGFNWRSTETLEIYWEDEKCDEDVLFDAKGVCHLSVYYRQIVFEGIVIDYTDKNLVVWTQTSPTECEVVQNMFVWLAQNRWIDIEAFVEENQSELDDDEAREMQTHLQEVLEKKCKLDLQSSRELWEWCRRLSITFQHDWSFQIDRKIMS